MKPQEVYYRGVIIDSILYDYDGFSVALLKKENGEHLIGCRWNTKNGGCREIGYPYANDRAEWFFLPDSMAIILIKSFLEDKLVSEEHKASIKQAIQKISNMIGINKSLG